MNKCCGCGKVFAATNDAVEFNLVRALLGEKSEALGFYPHPSNPDGEKDYVHFTPGCLEMAFSPVENGLMFDILADQVRQQIYEEESERDPEDYPEITISVLLEDPPYCLWCKRKDTVWCHFSRGYLIHNCITCCKLWDDDEDELIWDPAQGEYFLADPES